MTNKYQLRAPKKTYVYSDLDFMWIDVAHCLLVCCFCHRERAPLWTMPNYTSSKREIIYVYIYIYIYKGCSFVFGYELRSISVRNLSDFSGGKFRPWWPKCLVTSTWHVCRQQPRHEIEFGCPGAKDPRIQSQRSVLVTVLVFGIAAFQPNALSDVSTCRQSAFQVQPLSANINLVRSW